MAAPTTIEIDSNHLSAIGSFSRLHDWMGDWCMHESAFTSLVELVQSPSIVSHVRNSEPRAGGSESLDIRNGVAVIPIHGTMMKSQSSLGGGGTVAMRRQIREAAAAPEVAGIVLQIDSPGGTFAGTSELAREVAKANKQKPVIAAVEDMAASAAYWVASQAREIIVNETGSVGSIGTYGVLHDYSANAAASGVKVHVVKAGAFKGAGVPGSEITADVLQMLQERVEKLNQFFVSAVSGGRGLSAGRMLELADGRVHIGQEAIQLGLADSIGSVEDAIAKLQPQQKRSVRMSDTQPAAATLQEIKAACHGIDAATVVEYVEAGHTLEKATGTWMQELALRAAAAEEEAEKAKQEAATAATSPGVDPLEERNEAPQPTGSARDEFRAEVDRKVSAGIPRAKAVSQVRKADPDRAQRMIEEANAAR